MSVEEQPVTIYWVDGDGHHRRYTPDYRVVHRRRTEIVEVKYRADLRAKWVDYKPVFVVARDWATAHGMQFRIATDHYIRKPFLANAKRLVPRMHDPVPAEIECSIIEVLRRLQPISFSNFIEVTGASTPRREIMLSALWALLARRTIVTALEVEINGNSILTLPRVQA